MLGGGFEPGRVPWLNGHLAVEPVPERGEEPLRAVGGVRQARGELDEQRPQLVAELGRLGKEAFEDDVHVHQAALVGGELRYLHREPEVCRDGRCPAGVGRRAMGLVERRVDLDRGEAGCVPGEVRTLLGEAVAVFLRDRPACAPDADIARSAWIGVGHFVLGWKTSPRRKLRQLPGRTWLVVCLRIPDSARTATDRRGPA